MGLLQGKAGFVRYETSGELPENTMTFIRDRVEAYSFKDIDDTYDEYSIGFVSVTDMFDPMFNTDFIYGQYVVLQIRTDERKVPTAILKKYVDKEERTVKEEKQIPKLSRAMRIEIKERVKTELTRKAKPTPATAAMVWNTELQEVTIYSTNKKALSLVEDLFKEAFGMTLVQKVPYTIAQSFPGGEGVSQITQSSF